MILLMATHFTHVTVYPPQICDDFASQVHLGPRLPTLTNDSKILELSVP